MPFSLKVDGQVVTDGYGINQHVDEKLILELWPDRADIRELTKEALYGSSAPNIIAGLREDGRKSPTKYVARTFVGISDRDLDGRYETVLIFNSKTARQKDATRVLKDFGAGKVMMLDGGGSTQLLCEGDSLISSERLIPQAVGVVGGSSSLFSLFGAHSSTLEASEAPAVAEVEPNEEEEPAQEAPVPTPLYGGASKADEDFGAESAAEEPATSEEPAQEPLYQGGEILDVLWVPLGMLPVALLLLFIVRKLRLVAG